MADAPETLDMEVLCMQMIVDAGSAKSDYMEALQAVKAGDYETAAAKMKSGDEQYAAATNSTRSWCSRRRPATRSRCRCCSPTSKTR